MTDILDGQEILDDNGEDEDQQLKPDVFEVPDDEEAVEVVPPDVLEAEEDGS